VFSTNQPLVYGIALHPYVVGQPHRLHHLRRALQYIVSAADKHSALVWITKAGEIAEFVETLDDGVIQ
jgi:hypothetical protein